MTSPLLSRRSALRTFAFAAGAVGLPGFLRTRCIDAAEPAAPAAPIALLEPKAFTSTALGEGITLVTGAVCNIVVVNGEDGGLVIDSGIPAAASATASQIAKIAPTLSLLVNTHWHFDHVGGNERLARAGARIVAHENCRRRLLTEQYNEALDMKSAPAPRAGLPVVTLTSETRLHLNGEDFRLIPVAPAHTDGDVIVHLERANVVHMGDLFFNGMFPFIDYSSGGWIGGMIEGVKTGLPLTDAKTQIVPGHGAMARQSDLKTYLAFLETVFERLSDMKAQGKTVDEAVAAAPTKEFDGTFAAGFFKPGQFVRFAYTGLLRHG
jgi:glyoxylase-like metal-dependent hydrolase (beta-lactamase superfamily II)